MNSAVLPLCVISMLCGAMLTIAPEGGVRRVTVILCTAVLISAIIRPLTEMDMDSYAPDNAELKSLEESLLEDSKKASDKLNRLYIQQEYDEYIENKAQSIGISDADVSVIVQWNPEGVWVPYSVELRISCDPAKKDTLSGMIRDELGIPYERQLWYSE